MIAITYTPTDGPSCRVPRGSVGINPLLKPLTRRWFRQLAV